jgi:hypothetical protein
VFGSIIHKHLVSHQGFKNWSNLVKFTKNRWDQGEPNLEIV